ncbi:heme/hemin ABC transporter substrate-binding protein [Kingella kingae]|uniref:heme/hemin ABC transporter substrate-binding protein n=1 Tax=Kingella kingae TaxID=504 RepID=UPI002551C3C9|nr:ABC transporter substrate-binding protein [Kingella kingae]MDK4575162.1 ABC transporter substrate-binding protein [Kingella kingae]MDK4607283.1 ABC transporter substrate-binding protein [Kingella kingae]
MKKTALLLALLASNAFAQRIVVLTPDTAEIVAKLGAANEVVGIHEYNHLPEYTQTPTIGFFRTLSPESIVSKKPDLVLGSFVATPNTIFQNLKQSGVRAENVNPTETLAEYTASINRIGALIGKQAQASELTKQFQAAIKQQPATGKRYLLSYDGRYVSGRGTVGDTLIKLAGGINAADSVQGLKPLSREAWLAAKPDVIIIAKHNEAMLGGASKLAARPELSGSPAAKNGKIVFWTGDHFLRYSLHTPESIKQLNQLAK